MLTVIDNGVKVKLELCPQPQGFLMLMMITVLLLATVGVGLALGWLSVKMSIGSIAVIAVLSWLWRYYQQRYDVPMITGGELIVTANELIHHNILGKTQHYRIQMTDTVSILSKQQLVIMNNHGKIRYQVLGFNDPKHSEVVQAILQGKILKKQEKNIYLQE